MDGALVFSKAALGRHARPDEVVELVRPLAEAAEQKSGRAIQGTAASPQQGGRSKHD